MLSYQLINQSSYYYFDIISNCKWQFQMRLILVFILIVQLIFNKNIISVNLSLKSTDVIKKSRCSRILWISTKTKKNARPFPSQVQYHISTSIPGPSRSLNLYKYWWARSGKYIALGSRLYHIYLRCKKHTKLKQQGTFSKLIVYFERFF